MNAKKWRGQSHPRRRWFAKLAEEFGEVAVENSKIEFIEKGFNRAALIEELKHLEFIAREFRRDLERP
jgi:hypothetical protein